MKLAAAHLGLAEVSLRRAIERNAYVARDGATEAAFDGLVARKIGRVWRVRLGASWLPMADAACYSDGTVGARRGEE